MTKINRKFNTMRKRIERWHNIMEKLAEFEPLVHSLDGASPEEVQAIRMIHRKLYESSIVAKEQLKEAVVNGRYRIQSAG